MGKTAAALVVAAGRGTRLAGSGTALPKQYRSIAGRPVLSHTLEALAAHPRISTIVTVIHPDDVELYKTAARDAVLPDTSVNLETAFGGKTRQLSVLEGLRTLRKSGSDLVFIHDAARPFISIEVMQTLFEKLDTGAEGVLAAVPVADTLKKSKAPDAPLETIDRRGLWAAQTPQAFPFEAILEAHTKAAAEGIVDFTDDTGLAEWAGMSVELSDGDPSNFKITTATDLERANRQAKATLMTDTPALNHPLSQLQDIRTGIGYDVHAFDEGDQVTLGGVAIPHIRKLKGHSDADVVLHAITDATLGAIGDGDIGQHFPPSDPQWKGASSDRFQFDAIERVKKLGGRLAHIDVTIVCEEPKIGPHRAEIRASVAQICELPVSRVSVKATTSERLGFTGRKEGIAALANVTVRLPFPENE
ncbi:bifunctional 2-C-methyl-D-erythritol 4-phosphate cytidylyltransferase/2-C-methyl-D-erythritol 2,4-cyclodiphosphate synthase [uncultured Roseibium sp.]|uniref:bifunctional 2-C-methyl-D-erythritol 4-phosphate cytidylyltransferase/2-C-methyl-D-erythritol 2,4-cyclodiphosphate synthase n=1 Tax=uncultured Roseibium sp. TaxID=1936171 RepID=UPI00262DE657|nr:bifunctional 2-C-methyl-D-erythritol 4-phosphate cytidylyltransferase/2-C-methyl-D-erythritol 2,4-cyclodiphosphate synthase [uncultured Roseibium sp.]